MSYLLDTNIICELVNKNPQAEVVDWINQIPGHSLFLSVLTLGEIRKGVDKIADQKRKQKILLWLENELPKTFHNRVLPISRKIADRWGRLQHMAKRPLPAIDSLLAATALHHDMTLVTRNTKDFQNISGLEIINPWKKD